MRARFKVICGTRQRISDDIAVAAINNGGYLMRALHHKGPIFMACTPHNRFFIRKSLAIKLCKLQGITLDMVADEVPWSSVKPLV